jgi:hypothetical protein
MNCAMIPASPTASGSPAAASSIGIRLVSLSVAIVALICAVSAQCMEIRDIRVA